MTNEFKKLNCEECKSFLKNTLDYIMQNAVIEYKTNYCEIITPFLAYNNENISLYIEIGKQGFKISDCSDVFFYLNMISIDLEMKQVKKIVKGLQAMYGFNLSGNEVIIQCNKEDLEKSIINHITAQLSLYNLEFLNSVKEN
jgi:hypothetical protein